MMRSEPKPSRRAGHGILKIQIRSMRRASRLLAHLLISWVSGMRAAEAIHAFVEQIETERSAGFSGRHGVERPIGHG